MAGEEDMWFTGRFPSTAHEGAGDNNGGSSGNPNLPSSGFSLPVPGIHQSSGSGFSSSFSGQPNDNSGSFFDPSSSFSSFSGVVNQDDRFKMIKPTDSIFQGGEGSSKGLGLTLSKTNSFVNLVDERLAGKKRASPEQNQGRDQHKQSRTRPNMEDNFVPQQSPEKMKATNFPIRRLQVGNWRMECSFEGQLVAKCYYSKRKLVWELLEGSLKKKMEIPWSDISALRIAPVDNDPAILQLELKNPPQFFGETNPQPRKHTLWQRINDFTGGQASSYRRHWLKFPPGVLGKQYEKLLQCDRQLYILSTHPFPSSSDPSFPPSNRQELDFRNGRRPAAGHAFRPTLPPPPHPCNQPLQASLQKPPGIWNTTSPTSVMEFGPIDETATGHEHGAGMQRRNQGLSMVTGFPERGEIQRLPPSYIVPGIQAKQEFGLQGCKMPNSSMDEYSPDGRIELARLWSMDSPVRPQQQQQQQQVFSQHINRTDEPAIRPADETEFWGDILTDKTGTESFAPFELQQASDHELLLPSSEFLSQTMNRNSGFPALIEDQKPNIQTPTPPHWMPQMILPAPVAPQGAGQNQMMHFRNFLASEFLNDDKLMQAGSSYPNTSVGTQRGGFDDIWNQYG